MRPSVRLHLTLVYGALFLVAGAILLGLNYALVQRSLVTDRVTVDFGMQPDLDIFEPGPGAMVPRHGAVDSPLPIDGSQVVAAIEEFEQEVRDQTLDRLVVQSVQALAVMAVASTGLGWVVAGRILRPLQEITGTARRLSEENLHERIALAGPDDELKELADTFDSMLARLDTAFESQRLFAANAAHELRTPLAIMRTEIDVALADPDVSAAELRDMAATVLGAVGRINALLDGLLVLASSAGGASASIASTWPTWPGPLSTTAPPSGRQPVSRSRSTCTPLRCGGIPCCCSDWSTTWWRTRCATTSPGDGWS